MSKLIGYTTMKKFEGKVLFLANENAAEVGHSCDTLRVYGKNAEKITSAMVGKNLTVVYGKINHGEKMGQAYIQDLIFN